MNRIDRPALLEVATADDTTNTVLMTYISIVGMSNMDEETGYPTIENYTTYKLAQYIIEKMPFMNESSVRFAIKRLHEQNVIGYMDEKETRLAIFNFTCAHIKSDMDFKSDGYVTIPHYFFTEKFYSTSLRAKRLAFILTSRLNGNPSKDVNLNFKSEKNPETYFKWCEDLKINRFAHIAPLLDELKPFFKIYELENNTYKFYLNDISRELVTDTDKLFRFTQVKLGQITKIFVEENKKRISLMTDDIKYVCEALRGENLCFARRVIKELCKTSRDNVNNFLGYTKAIMERLSDYYRSA